MSISRWRDALGAQEMCGVIRQFFAVSKRIVRPDGLLAHHVQARGVHLAAGQRDGQVLLLDQRPAGCC